MNNKRVWDPLYGVVALDDFEYGLIRLAEVQRLRYVRMCNINSMLVTGASEISRFEHTLGVLYLAQVWCKANAVAAPISRDIRAAAVLHDMQTGPFGHSMQYVLEDNENEDDFIHEDLSHGWRSTYHQELLAGASFAGRAFGAPKYLSDRWEKVTSIIRGDGIHGPLIAGTMDLDNIDNVVRLAYHVGVADRKDAAIPVLLAQAMKCAGGKVSMPASCVPAIERWQSIRRRLYELLLLDWAEFSAKAMLTRAIEEAARMEIIGADSWVRTDSEFLENLEQQAVGDAQEVRELIRRLRRGDLYEPVALLRTPSIELYSSLNTSQAKRELEQELTQSMQAKGLKPLVHFILDKGKTDRQVAFVSEENGTRVVVGSNSEQLLAGLFFSSSSMSAATRRAAALGFRESLEKRGAVRVSPLEDPMETTERQSQVPLV